MLTLTSWLFKCRLIRIKHVLISNISLYLEQEPWETLCTVLNIDTLRTQQRNCSKYSKGNPRKNVIEHLHKTSVGLINNPYIILVAKRLPSTNLICLRIRPISHELHKTQCMLILSRTSEACVQPFKSGMVQ